MDERIIKITKTTFSKNNHIPLLRKTGISLYKISLNYFIKQIKIFPEISSIYSLTKFNQEFLPGESDIDLVIIAQDMSTEKEINFLKGYSKKIKQFNSLFPFIQITFLLFEKDFKIYQEIMNKEIFPIGKHPTEWEFISGKETRIKTKEDQIATQKYGTYLRIFYEETLFNIYEHYIREENNFRRLQKYYKNIVRASNQKTENIQINKNNLIDTLYKIIKELEKIQYPKGQIKKINKPLTQKQHQEELKSFLSSIKKENLSSIFLSRIPHTESHYLYIILKDNLTYNQFKEQTENIMKNLDKIESFKKDIDKKTKSKTILGFPKIFPLILTEKMINIPELLGANLNPDEITNLQKNGIKLFGENLKINYDKSHFQKVSQKSFFVWANLNLIYSQFPKIQNEEKSILINKITKEYILNYAQSEKPEDKFSYKELRNIIKNERENYKTS